METPGVAPGTRPCHSRVILTSPCPRGGPDTRSAGVAPASRAWRARILAAGRRPREFSEMETPGFAPGTRPCGGRVILVSPCPQERERESRSAAQESHLPGPRGRPGYSRHRLSTELATEEDAPAWSCTRVSTFARWRLGSARPRKHVRGDAPTWSCTRVSAFGGRRLDLLGHGGEFVRMDPPGIAPGPSGFQPGALLLELEIRGSPPGSCTPIQAVRAPRPAVEREGRERGGMAAPGVAPGSPAHEAGVLLVDFTAMLPPGLAPGNSCTSSRRLC